MTIIKFISILLIRLTSLVTHKHEICNKFMILSVQYLLSIITFIGPINLSDHFFIIIGPINITNYFKIVIGPINLNNNFLL